MSRNTIARSATIVVTAGLVTLGGAGTALAHVTANPEQAPKGDHAKIGFRVPNEEPDAGTVRLKILLPLDRPLSSVQTTSVPGWTADVRKVRLDRPVTVAGARVDEAVRSITWTAQPGTRIGPDQFEEFEVSLGTLPTEVDQLVIPAEQTYDNGKVVRWDAPPPGEGGEEPARPAPTVELVDEGGHQSQSPPAAQATSDDTARWLGGAGLAVAGLSLGLGAGALLRGRKAQS